MKIILFIILLFPCTLWASTKECLDMTAHFEYADIGQAVSFSSIKWQQAIPVCEQALKTDSNNFKILYGLGRSYDRMFDETKSTKDIEVSISYYKKSFQAGYSEGAWAVAKNSIERKNWDIAETWLEKGIKAGSIHSANLMGLILYKKSYGYPNRDYEKAIAVLKTVENSDNQFVYHNLGVLYYFEEYQHENNKTAREYFEKAAKHEHDRSLYYLGQIYDQGYGVDKNSKKAVEYFQRAKKAGESAKSLDERMIQNAWNIWLTDDTEYQYYDIAINTLRSLALKDNKAAIKFLYRYKIGISTEITPLDSAIVQIQTDAYIKRASIASEKSKKQLTKSNIATVRAAITKYADLKISNGLYQDLITFFEASAEVEYGVIGELSKQYLPLIYIKLYSDFKKKEDAIKAITYAIATGEKKIINATITTLELSAGDNNTLDFAAIVKTASNQSNQIAINSRLNSFDTTLKAGASDRAINYAKSVDDINAQHDNDGVSMLHLAVWHDNLLVVKKLIQMGANINIKDHDGDTPLAYAIHKENIALITYLSSKGGKN